jgi:NAD-dependent SIR2 family protein deacetylase
MEGQDGPDLAAVGIAALAELMSGGGTVVLSGAGISTESGIPDYRGPDSALRRHTPMTYQTFVGQPAARRRYWGRSHAGWRRIADAVPNAGHHAVARLYRQGLLGGIITQNVDGLHQGAGAGEVTELHGSLSRVICLTCGDMVSRDQFDVRLRQANPDFERQITRINPDGDADLPDERLDAFHVVDCQICGGVVKPDVVFFGETVPAERVRACFDLVERARLLLVLGSSLTVMSGRRFVLRAAKLGTPVAIVNRGATRGDGYAALAIDAALGTVLPALADRLAGARRVSAFIR